MLFVDGDTPLIVDGEVVRVIGTAKQCRFWFTDGIRCARPKVAGGLCKAHAKEAADKTRCARHADLILPERQPWEFEGKEDELARVIKNSSCCGGIEAVGQEPEGTARRRLGQDSGVQPARVDAEPRRAEKADSASDTATP